MCSFGTNESIRRVVEQYSGALLRLAMTRLSSPADAEDASEPDAAAQADDEEGWAYQLVQPDGDVQLVPIP